MSVWRGKRLPADAIISAWSEDSSLSLSTKLAVHQPNATSRLSDIPLQMLEDKRTNEANAARCHPRGRDS